MSGRIAIFGYGPVGRATAARLLSEGREIVVAQREAPAELPKGATFTACDALEGDSVVNAARGAEQIVVAVGFSYSGAVWRKAWPRAVANFVGACETTGARMVFIDNLYMYGPQTAPLVETMELSQYGVKPAARSLASRVWMVAAEAGRARVAALRAPDFYGPGVGQSYLGDATIGAMAKGKAAAFIGSPDIPHDYAYVPDVARAAVTLLDAPDSAFGQAWHVPCAPTRTTRQILMIAADALGARLRLHAIPEWALGPAAIFWSFLREFREMRFQWDRPYYVDSTKFGRAFWSDATPFHTGIAETALAFQAAKS
jgi:nucleoside-diphosphate-sugar epimerase